MSLIFKTNLTTGGKRLINLLHISYFDLKKNQIIFHHAYQRHSVLGSFLFIGGGENTQETLTYPSQEEAEKEFNEITNTLDKYYTK